MNRLPLVFLVIASALSLVLAAPLPAYASDYSYARVVRLSLVDGSVQLARPGSNQWEEAIVNQPIQQGFSVATRNGRAEIEFESGATARLAENSVLQFSELALSEGGRITRLTLTQGTGSFYANLSGRDVFVVIMPSLQVSISRRADFRVDAAQDGGTVSVTQGDVEVVSRAGTNRLTKGHTLTLRAGSPGEIQVERSGPEDGFDRWVADRDEVIHTGGSQTLRYVSSPYGYGLADLYRYGNWYSISGYGACWRPHGVGAGWSPFSRGRWIFYAGLGWTWVSYEPWGWLPYHYGSWVFSPGLGWAWVAGGNNAWVWQSARVNWVRLNTSQVGWVAVHPQDRPQGTPMNLQHGIVTPVDEAGRMMIPRRIPADGDQRVEVIQGPPAGFGGAPTSRAHRSVSPPIGIAVDPGQRGIVFDTKTRHWVNNPDAPAPKGDPIGETSPARSERPVPIPSGSEPVNDSMRARQGFSGSADVRPPMAPPPPPAPVRSMGPSAAPPMPPRVQAPPPPVHVQTLPPPSRWESAPARPAPAPSAGPPPVNSQNGPPTPRQAPPAPPASSESRRPSRWESVPRNPPPRPQQQ